MYYYFIHKMYLITDLYRQLICIQPSLSTNRTGPNQRQPTPTGTPVKCPNLPNCLIAEVLRPEQIRQMKIHLSRKLFFRCFQNKLTKYFSTDKKFHRFPLSGYNRKSFETTDLNVSALEKKNNFGK